MLPAILKARHIDVNSFVLAGILLIPIMIFHVAMSYLRPAPAAEKASQWIWKANMLFLPTEEKINSHPWHKNLILWWALVAAAYVAIYVIFW